MSDTEIFQTKASTLKVESSRRQITAFRERNLTKSAVRRFVKDKVYLSAFLGDYPAEELLQMAANQATVGIPYSLPQTEAQQRNFCEASIAPVSFESAAQMVGRIEDELDPFRDTLTFDLKLDFAKVHTTIETSWGTHLQKTQDSFAWATLFKRKGSPDIMEGYLVQEFGPGEDPRVAIRNAAPYLAKMNTEVTLQPGRLPVVFLAEETEGFLRRSVESLHAEKYFNGTGLFTNQLERKIFDTRVNLTDERISHTLGINTPFDDEGLICPEPLTLVKNGILSSVIADLRVAQKYGTPATGNGRRAFNTGVSTNFHGLHLAPGSRPVQKILSELETCVVVFSAMGGDASDQGEYSTPVQLAFLVNRGEVQGRLPQLTLTTQSQESLGSRLLEIASDSFMGPSLMPAFVHEMDVFLN